MQCFSSIMLLQTVSSVSYSIAISESTLLIIKCKHCQNFRYLCFFIRLFYFFCTECTASDTIIINQPLVIFTVFPVCLTDIHDTIVTQDFCQCIITCLSCLFFSIHINDCLSFRVHHCQIIPAVLFNRCLCRCRPAIHIFVTFRRHRSIRFQNSNIVLFQILLRSCIRCRIKSPVCSSGFRLRHERHGHFFHSCQKTLTIFHSHFQEIAAAVQIQSISAILLFQSIRSLCDTIATDKACLFIVKCKICQNVNPFHFFHAFNDPFLAGRRIISILNDRCIICCSCIHKIQNEEIGRRDDPVVSGIIFHKSKFLIQSPVFGSRSDHRSIRIIVTVNLHDLPSYSIGDDILSVPGISKCPPLICSCSRIR